MQLEKGMRNWKKKDVQLSKLGLLQLDSETVRLGNESPQPHVGTLQRGKVSLWLGSANLQL